MPIPQQTRPLNHPTPSLCVSCRSVSHTSTLSPASASSLVRTWLELWASNLNLNLTWPWKSNLYPHFPLPKSSFYTDAKMFIPKTTYFEPRLQCLEMSFKVNGSNVFTSQNSKNVELYLFKKKNPDSCYWIILSKKIHATIQKHPLLSNKCLFPETVFTISTFSFRSHFSKTPALSKCLHFVKPCHFPELFLRHFSKMHTHIHMHVCAYIGVIKTTSSLSGPDWFVSKYHVQMAKQWDIRQSSLKKQIHGAT